MNEIKASDFPQVYVDLGIDTSHMGCIMIDTAPIKISNIISEEDFYYSGEANSHTEGNVSEVEPHVTLLYGLLSSGPAMKKHVDAVLGLVEGAEFPVWFPKEVTIDKVSFFYGKDSEYVAIIALIKVTPELEEANSRLKLLPHINTFSGYKPHITLAYVKLESQWQSHIAKLNDLYDGESIKTIAINYGD